MQLAPIILFPLFGSSLLGLISLISSRRKKQVSVALSGTIASAMMCFSFLFSVIGFFHIYGKAPIDETLFNWIATPSLKIDFKLHFDALSSLFCLVITGVGALIHVYSIGYMAHDKTPARYFTYLNLFCVMMLILVLGSSLPLVFLGWEGVGLCSYLLIGYWHADANKVSAGRKAFVMNRIGDVGFMLGAFLAFKIFGTFELQSIQQSAHGIEASWSITALGLLLFLACTGKSAQFPLFTWLPDAMAGPTPVSALIHAATMVTSGIYLLARLSNVVEASNITMLVIAYVGIATSLLAAFAAIGQNDIKKVLAYSTVSQLGLMFVACGVSHFDAAVFHVITHAFF